jgi:hypothetical protein
LQVDQICREREAGGAHEKQRTHGPFEIGLIQQALQLRHQIDLQKSVIDPGYGAEQFTLAEIDNRSARFRAVGSQSRIERGEHLLVVPSGRGPARDKQQSYNGEDSDEHQDYEQYHFF